MENLNDYFVSAGSALNGRFPAYTQPIQATPEEAKSVFKFIGNQYKGSSKRYIVIEIQTLIYG